MTLRRYFASVSCQAESWRKPRRVVAKVEWHPGELYRCVGFTVTNLTRPAERVVAFYNQRGTAEQWIKEDKDIAFISDFTRHGRCIAVPSGHLGGMGDKTGLRSHLADRPRENLGNRSRHRGTCSEHCGRERVRQTRTELQCG